MNARERAERAPNAFRNFYWAQAQRMGDPATSRTLIALAGDANGKGECFPAIARLAYETEQSESTIKRQLRRMVELGVIAKVVRYAPNGRQTSNVYVLHLDKYVDTHPESLPPGGGGQIDPLPQSDPPYERGGGGGQIDPPATGDRGEGVTAMTPLEQPISNYPVAEVGGELQDPPARAPAQSPPKNDPPPPGPADAVPWRCSLHQDADPGRPCTGCRYARQAQDQREADMRRRADLAARDERAQQRNRELYDAAPEPTETYRKARAAKAKRMAVPVKPPPAADVPPFDPVALQAAEVEMRRVALEAAEAALAAAQAPPPP